MVLDVDRRHAGALERLHGAPHPARVVEAALGVGNDWQLDRAGDGARLLDERVEGKEPGVREAEAAGGGGVAADVDAFEAVRLDELRAQRVGGARRHERAPGPEPPAKRSHARESY
jgi:hypothetical protein